MLNSSNACKFSFNTELVFSINEERRREGAVLINDTMINKNKTFLTANLYVNFDLLISKLTSKLMSPFNCTVS